MPDNARMTRGIRTAQIAFMVVLAVAVVGVVALLALGKTGNAVAAVPVLAVFVYAIRAYRQDPAHFNAPMTRSEILRAVLPLVAVIVLVFCGATAVALLSR